MHHHRDLTRLVGRVGGAWGVGGLRGLAAVVVLAGAAGAWGQPIVPAPEATKPVAPGAGGSSADEDERTELVVYLKDGRRYTGPVVRQNAEEVVISIAGIPKPFATEEIDRLEVLQPLMERYAKLRDAVGSDPDQIVNLAEWLQQRGKYELALTEVLRALAVDKNNGPAIKLKALLEQQIILKSKRVPREQEPATPAAAKPAPDKGPLFPVLSKTDIELMKVYETNLDEKPRVIIGRPTITKMLQKYAGHPLVPVTREGRETVLRQPPLEVLDLMFKLQAREFYSDVEVLDQPRAFPVFREQICRKWLVNSCSTTLCHGGMEAGRLVLRNHSPNSDQTVYTNFYILSKFKLSDGTGLVNWEEPEKSPLVQMGLPRDKSRRPHPEVAHGVSGRDMFKPVFQSTEDVQYKEVVAWMKSLYRPRPEYPISYIPIRPFEPPPKPQPVESKPATDNPGSGTPAPKSEPKPR